MYYEGESYCQFVVISVAIWPANRYFLACCGGRLFFLIISNFVVKIVYVIIVRLKDLRKIFSVGTKNNQKRGLIVFFTNII